MRLAQYFAFAAIACGSPQQRVTPSSTTTEQPPAPTPPATPGPTPAPVAAPAPAPAPATPARPARNFPPPDIAPPHARSAEQGDGRWTPYPPGSPFAKTVIHPHEASRFIAVTLVAIDLASASVHFMPGTEDLGGKKAPFNAGLVPSAERDRLLAVFNGGFQPRHGNWGMKLGDVAIVPPRDPGCTLALYTDGTLRLRSWSALAASEAEMRALRQTPPCLLEDGAVHPDLVAGRDKAWKGNTAGLVTRRRSAIGLDERGEILFYAIGVEATPRLLAEGLRFAGARHGAELDINWNWTRFLLYEKGADGKPRVAASLVEGEYSKSGYVERPSERDFFYVLRK
jgi:hypothetical protein